MLVGFFQHLFLLGINSIFVFCCFFLCSIDDFHYTFKNLKAMRKLSQIKVMLAHTLESLIDTEYKH